MTRALSRPRKVWHKGSRQLIEVTLVREDANKLSCASNFSVEGLNCGYLANSQPRVPPPPDDAHLLRPYCNVKNDVLLAAGLWDSPGLRAPLPNERFTVMCNYDIVGVLKSVSLRWSPNDKFEPAKQGLPVGILKDCVIRNDVACLRGEARAGCPVGLAAHDGRLGVGVADRAGDRRHSRPDDRRRHRDSHPRHLVSHDLHLRRALLRPHATTICSASRTRTIIRLCSRCSCPWGILLLGFNSAGWRFPALCFGTLSILLAYWLGKPASAVRAPGLWPRLLSRPTVSSSRIPAWG